MDRYAIITGRQPQKVVPIDIIAEIETFGFEKKIGAYERYRARANFIDRGAIIFAKPDAVFRITQAHFRGRYFLCKASQGSKCCIELGPPKYRIGTIICKYQTDQFGTLTNPFSYNLFPWIFDVLTYEKLKLCNAEYPLNLHDIKISCSNEEYQCISAVPCKEILWNMTPGTKFNVFNAYVPVWNSLKEDIADDLSLEQIDELLKELG